MTRAIVTLAVVLLALPGVHPPRAGVGGPCEDAPRALWDHLAVARSVARDRHPVVPSVNLLLAMIHVESRFQVGARSDAGALGLMQVMPVHHVQRYGFLDEPADLLDPRLNLMAGTLILTENIVRHDGVEAALRAYHGGSGAVDDPGPATRQYERLVMDRLEEMRACQD